MEQQLDAPNTMDKTGLVIAYTGDGKGKTTAALGMACRALGYGKKICIIQFIKDESKTGEKIFFAKQKNITIDSLGLGFVGIMGDKIDKEEHIKAAKKALERAKKKINEKCNIVILDEIFVALNLSLIEKRDIIELIKLRSKDQSLVMTGRGAPTDMFKYFDLITEMKNIKHPFDSGVEAVEGIDF